MDTGTNVGLYKVGLKGRGAVSRKSGFTDSVSSSSADYSKEFNCICTEPWIPPVFEKKQNEGRRADGSLKRRENRTVA